MKQASRLGEPDIEIIEPDISDNDVSDNDDSQKEAKLNAKNLYKFNSLLS
jgi:hypothetical protein